MALKKWPLGLGDHKAQNDMHRGWIVNLVWSGKKMTFKNRLLEFRRKNQMMQVQIAKILGVSQTCVSYWETGERCPSVLVQVGVFHVLKKSQQVERSKRATVEKKPRII